MYPWKARTCALLPWKIRWVFLDQYDQKVILDEVQRVPELFSYIQSRVDESGQMGQFILSGSQNFHLLNSITQTLAGGVALFKLLPLDFTELKANGLLETSYASACIKGFYPAIFDRDIDPAIFYANYVQTYLEKDVTELLNIRDIKLFRTFLSLCAGRAGQLVNFSSLANECDISMLLPNPGFPYWKAVILFFFCSLTTKISINAWSKALNSISMIPACLAIY